MPRTILGAAVAALLSAGAIASVQQAVNEPTPVAAEQRALSESERANQLFDDIFDRRVMRDPEYQTYLGIKQDYNQWSDISEAAQKAELDADRADLALVEAIDVSKLDRATRLSHQLMKANIEERIEDYFWRHHSYPVNQMFGVHSAIPAFLINQHAVDSVSDAEAYIARLTGVRGKIDQLIEQLKIREDKGVIAPDFVLPHVLRDSRNLLVGAPFDGGDASTLLADFDGKIAKLDISETERTRLRREAEMALLSSVQPAYRDLIAYVEGLQAKATHDAGAWKLPGGEAYYEYRLRKITTTDLTADQIHEIGLAEVARIHDEMRAIKDKVGFEGDLQAFMAFMREDPQFYLPSNDEGRAAYLERAEEVLAEFDARMDELFLTRPKAALEVKRVEAFRERSAGKVFYQQPAPDGSRPGKYYANLYDMSQMPTYQLEALAYHEGLPGHHMQIAIKQELTDVPKFRRFGGVTAYSEGWGLYSELLPKEIGLYQDPYSDFGRLAMELWRAVRLVVDTGMHAKGWSREESIDFYATNTPNARADAVKMVERHSVMPGQATAYKIGMLKILEEREKARVALGDAFDIREFHDVILKDGAVPLRVMEQQVEAWIESKRALAAKPVAAADRG